MLRIIAKRCHLYSFPLRHERSMIAFIYENTIELKLDNNHSQPHRPVTNMPSKLTKLIVNAMLRNSLRSK